MPDTHDITHCLVSGSSALGRPAKQVECLDGLHQQRCRDLALTPDAVTARRSRHGAVKCNITCKGPYPPCSPAPASATNLPVVHATTTLAELADAAQVLFSRVVEISALVT